MKCAKRIIFDRKGAIPIFKVAERLSRICFLVLYSVFICGLVVLIKNTDDKTNIVRKSI